MTMPSKNKKKMQQEENVIIGMKNCNICMKRTISIDIWGRKKSDVSFINIQNPITTNTTQSQISDAPLGFALKVWKKKPRQSMESKSQHICIQPAWCPSRFTYIQISWGHGSIYVQHKIILYRCMAGIIPHMHNPDNSVLKELTFTGLDKKKELGVWFLFYFSHDLSIAFPSAG